MAAANMMDLVRELKELNERKKAGAALSPAEAARRKELKETLRIALEQQKSGQGGSGLSGEGASVVSQSGPALQSPTSSGTGRPVQPASSVPSRLSSTSGPAVAAPAPAPARSATPAPMPAVAPATAMPASPAPAPAAAQKPAFDPRKAFMIKSGKTGLADAAPDEPAAVDRSYAEQKGKIDPRNAFAIKGFDNLMNAAASSDAVGATFKHEKVAASREDVDEATAKADAALRATKKRERSNDAEVIVSQLQEIETSYTPAEENLALEDYYGGYVDDGFDYIENEAAISLQIIDPREMELHRAGIGEGTTMTGVPAGLAFLDDFPALYTSGALPSPADDDEEDIDDPNLLIPGRRKVTVHLANATVKRGAIRRLAREDLGFLLEPQGAGRAEEIPISQIKAIFVHRRGRESVTPTSGRPIAVTFRDRRTVQGYTSDYQPGLPMFTMTVSGAQSAQFELVVVNAQAVAGIR
jgi:hypothetical protein